MDCSQSGSDLERIVMKCLLDWNIDKKVSTVTVDNASSNDVMVSLLKLKLNQDRLLVFSGNFFHVCCTTHILNLIVKDGLSTMGNTLNRIRESCRYVRLTPQWKMKWEEVVDQVGVSTKEEICYDCPTRWNSTYEMIATALVYEQAFKCLQKKDEDFKTNPSREEWELAREICKCLQIFYVSTMDLSGMDYPTANLYFPHVCEIHITLIEWKSSANEVLRKMVDSMFEKFKKYWSSTCLILAVAFVLNPGCKLKFVENYYSLIYGGFDSALQTKKVRETMIDIYSEYSPPATNPLTTSQPSSSSSSQQQIILPNLLSSSKFIRFESWYQVEGIGTTQCKPDLDNYLEEPLHPLKDVSLLDWWKVNTPKYPTLSRMARDILCIPVTSVPSESTFSIGGRVLSDHRASLDPKMVQALMCTQNWFPYLSRNASTCSVSDDLMANDELNDVDDDYCSTIGISP